MGAGMAMIGAIRPERANAKQQARERPTRAGPRAWRAGLSQNSPQGLRVHYTKVPIGYAAVYGEFSERRTKGPMG